MNTCEIYSSTHYSTLLDQTEMGTRSVISFLNNKFQKAQFTKSLSSDTETLQSLRVDSLTSKGYADRLELQQKTLEHRKSGMLQEQVVYH